MARSGHVQVIKHGASLAGIVTYRLSGVLQPKSPSQGAFEAQIDYRIGPEAVDSRRVWFLGAGATALRLDYRPGEVLGSGDGQIVRDAMFGIDRRTGARISVKSRPNPFAQIAAGPYYVEMIAALKAAQLSPQDHFTGVNNRGRWKALANAARRRATGTVVFRTAEHLLRANEAAWDLYEKGPSRRGITHPRPILRFDRVSILRRLGAHYRELAERGIDRLPGAELDLSLTDRDLGEAVHSAVASSYATEVPYGNAGYEQTLTCPKSFSIAAFTAHASTRELWLDVMHESIAASTDSLMLRVGNARSGHEGDGQSANTIDGDGYAATVSIESYSRALDPHLHGHVLIPNRIVCIDGVERAIANGGRDLIHHAPWYQAEFERELRSRSTAAGLISDWEFDAAGQQWEVVGSDPLTRNVFSQGNTDVQDELAALLDEEAGPTTRKRALAIDGRAKRRVTASKGDETLSWTQVADRMRLRACDEGIDLAQAFAAPTLASEQQPENWDAATWAVAVDEHVCRHRSWALDVHIEAAVRGFAPHTWTDEQIQSQVAVVKGIAFIPGKTSEKTSRLGREGAAPFASKRVLKAEESVMECFTAGFDGRPHRIAPEVAEDLLAEWMQHAGRPGYGHQLTAGQLAMFRQMTSGADLTSVVVGSAGSGKTTALDAVRYAFARQGIRMYGVSTSAIATQGLKDAARIEGNTVAGLLLRIEFDSDPEHPARLRIRELESTGEPRDQAHAATIASSFALPPFDHLVIDEASMLAVTDQARIMEWAHRKGVSITLVGDHKQLKAVGPTSLLGSLISARGAARLSENLRQQTDVGRACANFLRDGRPHDALQILAAADQFLVARSEVEKNRLLIESWLNEASSLETPGERMRQTGLDADRNDQVDILNGLARHWARQRGWLQGDDLAFRHAGTERKYAIGDHIQVTKNIKRGEGRSLSNGTRAIVTALDPDGLSISYWDAAGEHRDRLTCEQAVTHAKHGYATTTHKLQGQTLKSLAIDFGGDRDLSSAYVAFTRSQDRCVAVVSVHDIAEGAELEALLRLDRESLTDAVVARVGDRLAAAGFTDQLTAHEVVGKPLRSRGVVGSDLGGIK